MRKNVILPDYRIRNDLKVRFSSAASNGFARCAFMPASIEFLTSSAKALAVMATIGMAAASERSRSRMALAVSYPFIMGI